MHLEIEALRLQIRAFKGGHGSDFVIDLARQLEELSLLGENMPDVAFAAYLDVFENEELCASSGVAEFIAALFTDFDRLSEEQRENLLNVFQSKSENFADELLQFSVGDLVARKFSPDVSLLVFERLWSGAHLYGKAIALAGINVLTRVLPESSEFRKPLQRLTLAMQG